MKGDQLKVLILEDVKSDAELVKHQFEYLDFDPEFKLTFKKDMYLTLLDTFKPDLILSDFNLPTFDGLKALKLLRKKDPVTPFIFVTGTLGEENAVEAIKTGATDFIPKERLEHLPASIIKAFRERDQRITRLQEESKFKALIENSSECTIIINEDTSVKYVSPSIKKVLGYSPTEFIASSILTYFPQGEVEDRMKVLKKVLGGSGNEPINDECKIRNKSGKYIWVSAILSDQRKTNGIEGVVINFRNIDDRKAIEREVKTSEMRFKALTHEGGDLISVINTNSEYTFVSGNHERVIGLTSRDLLGKRPIEFVHLEDAFRIMQQLEKLKKKKRVKPKPFRFKDAKGNYRWVESIFTNMLDDDLVAGIVINSRDVTEMVEKTNKLILSNERYELASKASGDHIYEWNLETGETYRAGDSLWALFGYTNEQAKNNKFWEDKVHPEDREETYVKLKEHFRHKKAIKCEHEYRFLKANGEYAYVYDTGYILRDEKGNATRMIGAVSDVTKRKRLEMHQKLMAMITQIMNTPEPLSHTLSEIAKKIAAFTNASVVEFWMSSFDDKEIFRVAAGFSDEAGENFIKQTIKEQHFAWGAGLPGKTWLKRESINLFRIPGSDFIRKKAAKKNGIDTGISVPLTHGNEVTAAMLLLGSEKQVKIDEYQRIMESIAIEMAPYLQRKKMEEELNRFFDLSPDVLCIAGMDGYYKKVNPAMCNMLGVSREELLSKPIVDFVHPEDVAPTANQIGKLSDGEPTLRFINRYKTKSGKYIWLSWKAIPVFEEGLIYAVARNITQQKELEDLLEKSQRLAKIGTWLFDPKNEKIEWTPIAREIYGVADDFEPTISNVGDFFPKEDHDRLGKRFNEAVNDGKSWDEEVEVIKPNGVRRWTRMTGNAEFMDRECIRVYGSIQDIHDLKSAEMEKIDILQSITDGFIGVNNEGIVTHWNHMAEELFSIEKEEALGANIWGDFGFNFSNFLLKELAQTMRAKTKRQFEYFIKKRGIWLEISVFPKRDGLTVYLRDVSDKRLMQKQLISAISETQERERVQFGRELHDGITQYLAASKMNLSHFKHLLEAGKPKLDILDKVAAYIEETIEESRNISHGLLSTTLQNQGLIAAIKEVFQNIRSNTDIELTLESNLSKRTDLSKEVELNIYRIVQELSNNLVKYANASKATLSCNLYPDRLELVMNDDGKGIDGLESGDFKKGAGLNNIYARVKAMNGSFELENTHPGLKSMIVIPLNIPD